MKTIQLFCCILVLSGSLLAQTGDNRSAAQLAEDYIKLRDPARVDDLKKFPPEQAIPAYYNLRREAWEDSVRDRAEILMMNTPGWDKWFLDELWSRLPASLYYPDVKEGDPVLDDPVRLEQIQKAASGVAKARREAEDLIHYLGGVRDPRVIRILGPILLLTGEVFGNKSPFDSRSGPPSEAADGSLFHMRIHGYPFEDDEKRQWWLKNKDLTDEQWWELLRKGRLEYIEALRASTPAGRPVPPLPPVPVPVTPPPVLIPKPITPVPVPRIMPRSSLSAPRRQPQVPQLASEAEAFWPRWLALGSVTTGLGWLLLRRADGSS